jgi:hypothetical protein
MFCWGSEYSRMLKKEFLSSSKPLNQNKHMFPKPNQASYPPLTLFKVTDTPRMINQSNISQKPLKFTCFAIADKVEQRRRGLEKERIQRAIEQISSAEKI